MSSQAARVTTPDGVPLGLYLPVALAVTLAVTVWPLAVVSQLGPPRGLLGIALHVLAAVVMSILLSRVLAALWTRQNRSGDVVFGDLLLWGWARRALAERRLDATARNLAASAEGDRVALLQRMSTLLEMRDPYTHGHSRRVARHAERIAREMGLPREQIATIRSAALVHDVGKVNLPRSILTKPGGLTDEEFALVKRHPGDGAAIVVELADPQLTAIVRHHHERLDGTGYPDGLGGHDIPLGARVIAVADTFDAITSARAYRKPRTHGQALEILTSEAGSQLDPVAVAAFSSYYRARRSVGFASMVAAVPQRLLSGLAGVQSGVTASVAPIAQTACGVGGVALLGACLAGPVLPPAASNAADADRGAGRELAQQASRSPVAAGAPAHPAPSRARPGLGDTGRAVQRERNSTPAPSERLAPRAPDAPGGGPPGSGSSGGSGGGGGGTPPATPDLPSVLSDGETVVQPVGNVIPPPQLQPPVLATSLGLP
jgi:hypothetical protein